MCIEGELVLESNEIETAIFILLAVYYVFNLTYQEKASDFFVFIQEKIAKISSVTKKSKASVVGIHVSGLCRVFNDLLKGDDNGTMD